MKNEANEIRSVLDFARYRKLSIRVLPAWIPAMCLRSASTTVLSLMAFGTTLLGACSDAEDSTLVIHRLTQHWESVLKRDWRSTYETTAPSSRGRTLRVLHMIEARLKHKEVNSDLGAYNDSDSDLAEQFAHVCESLAVPLPLDPSVPRLSQEFTAVEIVFGAPESTAGLFDLMRVEILGDRAKCKWLSPPGPPHVAPSSELVKESGTWYVAPRFAVPGTESSSESKRRVAEYQCRHYYNAALVWQTFNGAPPLSLNDLVSPLRRGSKNLIEQIRKDPWGNDYFLWVATRVVAVSSRGPDGELDTLDDIRFPIQR